MEEIREIPEGWEEKELGYLVNIINGTTPSRDNDRYWIDGTMPWATPTDITSYNGKYIEFTKECITAKALEEISIKVIPKDSILMTSRATLGELKINKRDMCTNQGFKNLVPKNVNVDFLYYLMDLLKGEYSKFGIGTTFLEVNKKDTERFKIIYPKSKKEQQKIATILSTLDKNIEKTEQTIEKYKNIKSGLMDDLLTGKRRIKDGKWVVETEFKEVDGVGRVPREWEVGVISDLADINPKKNTKKLNKWDLVSFIKMEDTSEESKIINMFDKVLSEVEKGYTNFHDNDILFAKITPCLENGKGGLAKNLTNGIGFGSTEFHILRPKKIYSTQLLYQYSKYNKLRSKAASLMIGSAGQQRIQKDFFESYIIGIPTENEQTIIGNILSKQDHLIEKEQQYLKKLKNLKSGLMEDLLTGKVRVK